MAAKKKKNEIRLTFKTMNAETMLAIIRAFSAHAHTDSVWALYSAMAGVRGPDDNNVQYKLATTGVQYKLATTGVIRHHLFGGPAHIPGFAGPDNDWYVEIRKGMKPGDHFTAHAQTAFSALGLDWNKNNDPKEKLPEPKKKKPAKKKKKKARK